VLVEEDVLELEIAVDAGLLVDITNGADQLRESLLDLFDGKLAMLQEVVVQFVACPG
jgi:hypothetical protein